MEEIKKQYLLLLSEIIAIEAVVLGPIAILKAKNIPGLDVDNNGKAVDVKGDMAEAVKVLVDVYMELSSRATGGVIDLIFQKYPQIHRIK